MDLEVWPLPPRRDEGDAVVHHGVARCGDLVAACTLGRSGIAVEKREGDGVTPSGRFPVRRVMYRTDRGSAPSTAIDTVAIDRDAGWCDDPADPAYNRPIRLPYTGRHEKLWREDHLYDLVLVIGHNDDPVVPGLGSAIFVHVMRTDRGPTEGCVAFAAEDLRRILSRLDATSRVIVHAESLPGGR